MTSRWGRVAVGYILLATLAAALVVVVRDGVPWKHPEPLLVLHPAAAHLASAALGLVAAAAILATTRVAVLRFPWASRLHAELRPLARDMSTGTMLLVAACSSLGEELLFRGLLTPLLGVVLSSVVFGLLHQLPGPSRWIWVTWATLVGMLLGAMFRLTGSLLGPLLCHAVANAVNLMFLRDHEPERR